jgi:hypothetical protein
VAAVVSLIAGYFQWLRDRTSWRRQTRLEAYSRYLSAIDVMVFEGTKRRARSTSAIEHNMQAAASTLSITATKTVQKSALNLQLAGVEYIKHRISRDDYMGKRSEYRFAVMDDLDIHTRKELRHLRPIRTSDADS